MTKEQEEDLKKAFLKEWDKTFRWMPTEPEDIINWVIKNIPQQNSDAVKFAIFLEDNYTKFEKYDNNELKDGFYREYGDKENNEIHVKDIYLKFKSK